MKKTLHIDASLLRDARTASGARTDTETVRLGLEALVRRAAYERLRTLRGSEPGARDVPRRTRTFLSGEARHGVSVLVDTSVWIRFLANRGPYAGELDALLGRDEVRGHEFVYGELLIGDPSGRKALLSRYELIDSGTDGASPGGCGVCSSAEAPRPGNRLDRCTPARIRARE
jgi:hypothetical protein